MELPTPDLRDGHVYGGIALAALGAEVGSPGLLVLGVALAVLGLRAGR